MSQLFRAFSDDAWSDYVWWQSQDEKTVNRINELVEDIARNESKGIGNPEQLTFGLSGWRSRRIDDKNRLVYKIEGDTVLIASCRFHYSDR